MREVRVVRLSWNAAVVAVLAGTLQANATPGEQAIAPGANAEPHPSHYEAILNAVLPGPCIRERAQVESPEWIVTVRGSSALASFPEYEFTIARLPSGGLVASATSLLEPLVAQVARIQTEQPRLDDSSVAKRIVSRRIELQESQARELLLPLADAFERMQIHLVPDGSMVLDPTTYEICSSAGSQEVSALLQVAPGGDGGDALVAWIEKVRAAIESAAGAYEVDKKRHGGQE